VVWSDSDQTNGIRLTLVETSEGSGIYRGSFRIDTTTLDSIDQIAAKPGDTLRLVSSADRKMWDCVRIISGELDHFVILHDGAGSVGAWEKIVLRAEDGYGMTTDGFIGEVTLFCSVAGSVQWTNLSGSGSLVNLSGTVRSNWAVYTFQSGDMGLVTLAVRDFAAESIDPDCKAAGTGIVDDDRAPQWLVFSGGMISIGYGRYINGITLGGEPSIAMPGATCGVVINCTNRSAVEGKKVLMTEWIDRSIVTFSTQINMAGWSAEYATNIFPDHSYLSSDFVGILVQKEKIRWLRWKKNSVSPAETASFEYRIIVK
jgi:hypothetical protein